MSSHRRAAAVERLTLSRARLQCALQTQAAGGGASEQLAAFVLRHPLGTAFAALLLGALLTRAQPWRWVLKPALWAVLWPQAVAALAGAPLGTWAQVLAGLWHQHASAAEEAAAAAPPAGAAPPAAPPA